VEDAAVYGGIALSILGLAFASLGGLKLLDAAPSERAPFSYPIGLALIACLPPFWDYGTAGLELGLSLAFLGGLFYLSASALCADRSSSKRALFGAAFIGLGPLIRPDFALMSALYGLLWLFLMQPYWRAHQDLNESAHGRWLIARRLLAIFTVAIALPLAYQIFRMGYFAALVPNTALAKEAFSSRWDQGGRYLLHLLRPYHLHLPLILVLTLGLARAFKAYRRLRLEGLVLITPIVAGLLHGLYIIRVGGDFMHARLLLPALFLCALPVALFPICAPHAGSRYAPHLLAIGLLLYAISAALFFRVDRENIAGIGDERGWYMRMAGKQNATHIEDFAEFEIDVFYRSSRRLREQLEAGCEGGTFPAVVSEDPPCKRLLINDVPIAGAHRSALPKTASLREDAFESVVGVVARIPIGMAGMVLGPHVHLVDRVGLADPLAARFLLERRGRPGHEKIMSDVWLYARFAERNQHEPRALSAARDALECEPLSSLFSAIMEPLSLSRFMRNLTLAPRLHRLRLPADPLEAKAAFCSQE